MSDYQTVTDTKNSAIVKSDSDIYIQKAKKSTFTIIIKEMNGRAVICRVSLGEISNSNKLGCVFFDYQMPFIFSPLCHQI